MRTIVLIVLLVAGCYQIAEAQSFVGIYTVPTSNGVITLTLEQSAPGSITGTLVGDDGITFRLQGTAQGDEINGSLANATGTVAMVEGRLDGSNIRFYLIPLDSNGQPNDASAQEFAMTRQGQTAPGGWNESITSSTPSPMGGAMTSPSSALSSGLAGSYTGDLNGTPATLTLQQNGTSLSGTVNASGYQYTLTGTANGSTGRGTLTDPQNGGAVEIELAAQGGTLTLTLLSPDPNTGQVQRVPLSFQRGGTTQINPQYGTPSAGVEANVERDPALIGSWAYSKTYFSGDFSGTTRLSMQVNPDGTYLYGNGRVMIGGENDMGSVSGDTGNSGNMTRGRWRTQGNIIYVMEEGAAQWVPYARYYVEGGRMLLTFGDGSKQQWRQQ